METLEIFKKKLKNAVLMEAHDLENTCIKPAFSVKLIIFASVLGHGFNFCTSLRFFLK